MFRAYVCCLVAALALAAPASAQPNTPSPSCSAHVNGQWQPLDAGSLPTCLALMDRAVPAYNAQGFKFGLWGRTLLSGDRYYFYSSQDGGRNWQAVGLKTEVAETAAPAATAAAETATDAVLGAVSRDALPPDAAVPEGSTPTPASEEAAGASATVVIATAAAVPTAPRADRRSCSIHVGSNWERVANLTLEECAAELDRSPDEYDGNGFKYAYWSGVFLAADSSEILQSADSRRWERLSTRAGR